MNDPISGLLMMAASAMVGGALFACADAAMMSLSAARLGALEKEAPPRLRSALERAARLREVLQARYVLGRNICISFGAGCFTLWLVPMEIDTNQKLGLAGAALLLSSILIEFATTVGRKAADLVVPMAVYLLRPLELLVMPVAAVSRLFSANLTRRWDRIQQDPKVAETEVELMVDEGQRSGLIEQDGAEMIRNVLEFSELTASDVMVPRTKIVAIKIDTPISQVLDLITQTGHSRYPVYRDAIDDVFGLLYAKDLLGPVACQQRSETAVMSIEQIQEQIRPVKFVSESQPLQSLLRQMRQERDHLAVVVDEFGGMSGLVTLEDILEEIVGDIQDEHDHEEAPIVEQDGRLLVDASVLMSDLSAYLGSSNLDSERHDSESVGGMLVEKLGCVPEPNTRLSAFNLQFIVLESDEKHISQVEIIREADSPGGVSGIAEG